MRSEDTRRTDVRWPITASPVPTPARVVYEALRWMRPGGVAAACGLPVRARGEASAEDSGSGAGRGRKPLRYAGGELLLVVVVVDDSAPPLCGAGASHCCVCRVCRVCCVCVDARGVGEGERAGELSPLLLPTVRSGCWRKNAIAREMEPNCLCSMTTVWSCTSSMGTCAAP